METIGAFVVLLYFATTALAAIFLRTNIWISKRWISPSLLARCSIYALSNGLACLLLLLLLGGAINLYTHLTGQTMHYRQPPAINLAIVLLAPIPLAAWFTRKALRWLRSTAEKAIRKERVLYRSWGITPPLRLKPGTAMPASFRQNDFSRIDLNDDEMVREIARTHWQAINDATASRGDVTSVLAAQAKFLGPHLKELPPQQAEHIRHIYHEAGAPHAREHSRINDTLRDQESQLKERRTYFLGNMRRNTIMLAWAFLIAVILRLIILFT